MAAEVRLVSAWDARGAWADNGAKSAKVRLANACDLSDRTAAAELERARKLRTMPATAQALCDGKLSIDFADLLAQVNQPDVAHLFARDEVMLVDNVGSRRYRPAWRYLRYWLSAAEDEVDKAPSSVTRDGRHFAALRTFHGTVDLRGRLDPLDGAVLRTELRRIEEELFDADWAEARERFGPNATSEQLRRTPPQRQADALVEMARRSAAMPDGARFTRPLLTILAGYGAYSKICELADGTAITPAEVVPFLCACDIERIVFDGPSRVMEVGHRRLFTGALRRAIEVRDRHCQHPSGCDVSAEDCQIDHIVPSSEGGLTTQTNGRCACRVHNRNRNSEERGPPW